MYVLFRKLITELVAGGMAAVLVLFVPNSFY